MSGVFHTVTVNDEFFSLSSDLVLLGACQCMLVVGGYAASTHLFACAHTTQFYFSSSMPLY